MTVEETLRLTESVKELLAAGRSERLADLLETAHAADISAALRELPLPDQVHVFRLLTPQQAGEVLSELDDQTLLELVRALDETEVSRILDRMPSDHVVEVVEELPKEEADKILDMGPGRFATSVLSAVAVAGVLIMFHKPGRYTGY